MASQKRPAIPALWALLSAMILLCGCASGRAIDDAQKVLDDARQMHGDYLAPYWFSSAELYLAEARSQYEHSDFKAAKTFADAALAKAQEAYARALQKHPPPIEDQPSPPGLDTLDVLTAPKTNLQKRAGEIQQRLGELEAGGVKECAPKEYARAEAHLEFGREELDEGDFNRATEQLRSAIQWVDQAASFLEGCRTLDSTTDEVPAVE